MQSWFLELPWLVQAQRTRKSSQTPFHPEKKQAGRASAPVAWSASPWHTVGIPGHPLSLQASAVQGRGRGKAQGNALCKALGLQAFTICIFISPLK